MEDDNQHREPAPDNTDDGLTVGRIRLRYVIVGVITAIWVADWLFVAIGWSESVQPGVSAIFAVVVAWVLGIELDLLAPFKKD